MEGHEPIEAEEKVEARPLLRFRLGDSLLAVDATQVDEVTDVTTYTPVPVAPAHVVGLMNLRGHAIPIVDLHRVFELTSHGTEESVPRVVIVRVDDMRVGLMCDRVLGVEDVRLDAFAEPDAFAGQSLEPYARALLHDDDGVTVVLDLPVLLEALRVSEQGAT